MAGLNAFVKHLQDKIPIMVGLCRIKRWSACLKPWSKKVILKKFSTLGTQTKTAKSRSKNSVSIIGNSER